MTASSGRDATLLLRVIHQNNSAATMAMTATPPTTPPTIGPTLLEECEAAARSCVGCADELEDAALEDVVVDENEDAEVDEEKDDDAEEDEEVELEELEEDDGRGTGALVEAGAYMI